MKNTLKIRRDREKYCMVNALIDGIIPWPEESQWSLKFENAVNEFFHK